MSFFPQETSKETSKTQGLPDYRRPQLDALWEAMAERYESPKKTEVEKKDVALIGHVLHLAGASEEASQE